MKPTACIDAAATATATATAGGAGAQLGNLALFTDLYELTMLESYWHHGLTADATFSLFFRRLPPRRNFAVACGLHDVLAFLEHLRFTASDLEYLASLELFSPHFLCFLEGLRFTGRVRAMPEGTPVFPHEPLLEIDAPLPQAQLVETFVINQIHLQTVLASKAARVVLAARGRRVVDFGARRMHGVDAGVKSARAFFIAGVDATSNVLAGRAHGVPLAGTMAHSFVQLYERELDAFRAFARTFPTTTLLVDTYDTLAGVDNVIALARELGHDFRVRAVRLDSGDLLDLSRRARDKLDAAGLTNVQIFASGGLDEDAIDRLVREGAPIDAFGVGTALGVADDAPTLDMAYKLVEYDGAPRMKTSTGKLTLPGRKQVFREMDPAGAVRDEIALADEHGGARPLLATVMDRGHRIEPAPTLQQAREYARAQLESLPPPLRALGAAPSYPVAVSERLARLRDELAEAATRRQQPVAQPTLDEARSGDDDDDDMESRLAPEEEGPSPPNGRPDVADAPR